MGIYLPEAVDPERGRCQTQHRGHMAAV